MRLTKIKLAGFKSFVDPTTVAFPSNLVAILGPNGCGKSNTIDAVRWVMGESSAKNLRGEAMTDVIFNGSTGRKPVGQAVVELVFDNSDGKIVGEYASYNEISVKRMVNRDAQSTYFLNGVRCRRKDVTDLFLGTGLGPRSYAIIEQGMISRLIEARPEDLRIYLEEVAGISKYKERRRETETRIRHTRENLERLNDLREELGKQLERLERQAKAAVQYKELKTEERITDAQLKAMRWHNLDEKFAVYNSRAQEGQITLEKQLSKRTFLETQLEKLRLQHTEQNDLFQVKQQKFYGIGADVARLEQSLQAQRDRYANLERDLQQSSRQSEELTIELRVEDERLAEYKLDLADLQPQTELLEQQSSEAQHNADECEEHLNYWQEQWTETNAASADALKKTEILQTQIQHVEQTMRHVEQRLEKLREERTRLQIDDLQREATDLREQLAEVDERLFSLESNLDQIQTTTHARREQNHAWEEEIATARNELQQARGKLASLEALQQAALGKDGKTVQAWLESQALENNLRLAQNLQVTPAWQYAVETVLGRYLQAVCVDDLECVFAEMGSFNKGELAFIEKATATHPIATSSATLASHTSTELPIYSALQAVYCADDLSSALAMRKQLQAHESVITPEGIWLGAHWLRVARDVDAHAGVLAREQEIQQLKARIEILAQRDAEIKAQLDQGRAQLVSDEQQRDALQASIKELRRSHADIQAELSAKQARIEQIGRRAQAIVGEETEHNENLRYHAEQIKEMRGELEVAVEVLVAANAQRDTLQVRQGELQFKVREARSAATEARDAKHDLLARIQKLTTEISALEKSQQRAGTQLTALSSRMQELQQEREQLLAPIAETKECLEECLEARVLAEEIMQSARAELDAVMHSMRQCELGRNGWEQAINDTRTALEQTKLEMQTVSVRRTTIEEELRDFEQDLPSILATLPEGADEAAWEEALESLGRRIQRLGAINLAAIEEFTTESERKTYLDNQCTDLMDALTTLEEAIDKIDKETRARFKETFDFVNDSLKELFPRMFGGGQAYLELTGEDLLDTGVAIMARPPGKQNSTIHLLSGGEKALTAIALVFSMFRLNPAPFCMLDEVDAPLDDTNVGRFCRLVKEMADKVQFIFITHNKVTMELADHLMGVTMKEPGVSRLVSVDMQEAVALVT